MEVTLVPPEHIEMIWPKYRSVYERALLILLTVGFTVDRYKTRSTKKARPRNSCGLLLKIVMAFYGAVVTESMAVSTN
jgi:hypothetical protein